MKKTMLLLGLALIGQTQARFGTQPNGIDNFGSEDILKDYNKIKRQPMGNAPMPPTSYANNFAPQLNSQQQITAIVNTIMNNQHVPELYMVSSLKELNKVRDELFLKNAGANDFLRTPVQISDAEENALISILKGYKRRHGNNHQEYVNSVINMMKYLPINKLLLRPAIFQMSGITMSDLANAGVNFTTYRLSIKDRALMTRTKQTIFNNLTGKYSQFKDSMLY